MATRKVRPEFAAFKAQAAAGMQIEGIEELSRAFVIDGPREGFNLARSTVQAVASVVRDKMRKRAPRDEGTLAKAIVSRRLRGKPNAPESAVIVTHGSKSLKHDAFYWHHQEFGTVHHDAQPFIVPTIEEVRPKLRDIYREQFGKKYEKALTRKAKRALKARGG